MYQLPNDLPPLDPLDWLGAAQDAAFEGRCFAVLPDGRLLNADALQEGIGHAGPFDDCLVKQGSVVERRATARRAPSRRSTAAIARAKSPSLVVALTLFPPSMASGFGSDLAPALAVAA